jgi:hypothetical protein
MPTLFERLDVSLEGNGLATELSGQIAKLTTLTDTVVGLIQDPPDSLTDFSRILNELPFPELLGDGFASSLGSLQQALPTDLSSVLGELTKGLSDLQNTVGSELVAILDEALKAILAIYRLSTIDFTCLAQSNSGSAPAGGGPASGDSDSAGSGSTGGDGQPGGISEASNQVAAVNDVLDNLPSPLNVANFLDWLNTLAAFRHKAGILARSLPIVDDIIDPLNTLVTWNSWSSDQIRDHVAQSLQDLTVFVQSTARNLVSTLSTDITSAASALEASSLSDIADGLTTRLRQLHAALSSADLSETPAVVSGINGILDSYDALRSSMQTGLLIILPDLNMRLTAFADDVSDQMGHLVSTLRPNPAIGDIANAMPSSQTPPALTDTIEAQFQPLADWIQTLTDQLDLQAIQGPITTVADTARAAVDGLEQGLVQVTIQVRAIFGELESLLDGIDTEALVNEIEEAINSFASQLTQKIETLFAPARDAVSQIISVIDDQIDGFSPDQIIDPLRQALENLMSVFHDPAVVSAMDKIRNLLDRVKTQIEQLSFSPLTDQIIAGLDEISDSLQSIDTSNLNAMLSAALDAALAVLPDDLEPLTDPLIQDFDTLIESGPVPLLEIIKAQPERLMDRVRGFEPANLVGSALSAPFDHLLTTMKAFKPSVLLEPINNEIDKLKEQLKLHANPGQLLDLLKPAFDTLLSDFDRLKPEALVGPLNKAVNDTINHVLDVLPVDEVLEQIDKALTAVRSVLGFGRNLVDMLEKIRGRMIDLADSENQLTDWLSAILDKIDSIADLAPIENRFSELTAAIDETRGAQLAGLLQSAAAPVLSALVSLDPHVRHASLVQAYGAISAVTLAALPDSAEKTAFAAVLNRFDPMAPDFGKPYQMLGLFQRTLSQALSNLPTAFTGWDERYHQADGTLAGYCITGADVSRLRAWIQTEIDHSFLNPLKVLLAHVEALTSPVSAVFTQITDLVTALQNKVDSLLLGPDSLGGIRDALGDLIQRLRDFNLDFLTDSLKEIFDDLRGRIDSVNPSRFKAPLDAAFSSMLDAIDLGLIIPDEELQTLDTSFNNVIHKLELLNPVKLVTDIIQPEYEETVAPLVDAFDVTALLDAIIGRLRTLDEELKDELKRVNAAFRSM